MKYLLLIVPIALLACGGHTSPGQIQETAAPVEIKTYVIHDTRPVTVSYRGYLNYLYDSTLTSPLAAIPISISVNPGERVHKGALLLTYWPKYQGYDYTPHELHAPFSGMVAEIHADINKPVNTGAGLIRLIENHYLKMEITVNPVLRKLFRHDQAARVEIDGHLLEGFVRFYKRRSHSIELFFKNPDILKPPAGLVETHIALGEQNGSFLPDSLFSSTDTLQAYVPDLGPVEVTALGKSGSLIWIYPNIAGIDTLIISRRPGNPPAAF